MGELELRLFRLRQSYLSSRPFSSPTPTLFIDPETFYSLLSQLGLGPNNSANQDQIMGMTVVYVVAENYMAIGEVERG